MNRSIGRTWICCSASAAACWIRMKTRIRSMTWCRKSFCCCGIGGLMAALKFRILGERGRVTRRALRHAYSLDDDGAAPVSDRALSPEERAVFAGHVQAIRRLLKPDMAELFIDYAVNGCTPQQLAQKNGLTVSCVWMRLNRCKRRLREHPEFFYLFLLIVLGNGGHTV